MVAGGYFMARSAAPEVNINDQKKHAARRVQMPHEIINPDPEFKKATRAAFQLDKDAIAVGAIVGQRSLVFRNRAAMEAFLKRAGTQVNIMARIDGLLALRVGFLNVDDLAGLLDGTEEIGMIFPAVFPENESVAAQAGAVPMGNGLLEWLGVPGDHSNWGKGVRIAILDTGVSAHPAFGGQLTAIGQSGDVNGHGTAVASMILGNTSQLPGIAPGATVVSIQVADEHGYSDSFKIAQGIIAAIDAGVKIINISLGSSGDSAILRNAVEMARQAGVLIVAPTGNGGETRVLKPAAYDSVIGIGAVDKNSNVLAFSNSGKGIDLVAPGYGLNAAWTGDTAAMVSGTSFSSPIVAGLIAAVMQQMGVTNQQAWSMIAANLDEVGQPGYDAEAGNGKPNVARILSSQTKGIHDVAVASYWIDPNVPNMVQVTIQNQGTEPLINTGLTVSGPMGTSRFNATSLKVGEIQTFSVPIGNDQGRRIRLDATATISGGQVDARPSNNIRVESYQPYPNK